MHTWWLQVLELSEFSSLTDLEFHPTFIGIPVRNGVAHVREIARMSLRLMETVKVFSVMVMVMVMVGCME